MKTSIIVASGPSLTDNDCAAVVDSGWPIFVTNNTFERVRCDFLVACDSGWWLKNFKPWMQYAGWTTSISAAARHGIKLFSQHSAGRSQNSGQRAIELAAMLGAEKIVMVGFDCSLSQGIHWHGSHCKPLLNPTRGSVRLWHEEFMRTKDFMQANYPTVQIINCSSYTELDIFKKGKLIDEI